MAVTSTRTIQIEFSGDNVANLIKSATNNALSPGIIEFLDLAIGPNTISAPPLADAVPVALTIVPPSGNTILITLKGDAADQGIPLSLLDPTSIALDSTFVSLVLDVDDDAGGFMLIWN